MIGPILIVLAFAALIWGGVAIVRRQRRNARLARYSWSGAGKGGATGTTPKTETRTTSKRPRQS